MITTVDIIIACSFFCTLGLVLYGFQDVIRYSLKQRKRGRELKQILASKAVLLNTDPAIQPLFLAVVNAPQYDKILADMVAGRQNKLFDLIAYVTDATFCPFMLSDMKHLKLDTFKRIPIGYYAFESEEAVTAFLLSRDAKVLEILDPMTSVLFELETI